MNQPAGCCVVPSASCATVCEETSGQEWRRRAVSPPVWSHSAPPIDSTSWELWPAQRKKKFLPYCERETDNRKLPWQLSLKRDSPTCSSRPCLIQPRETLSSWPLENRSIVASKLVRRGTQLICTEVEDGRRKSADCHQQRLWKVWLMSIINPYSPPQSPRFTLQCLVPHLQCRWCRVQARQAELLTAPHGTVLKLVAPVPGLVQRPRCHSPGERLQLQNAEEGWDVGGENATKCTFNLPVYHMKQRRVQY